MQGRPGGWGSPVAIFDWQNVLMHVFYCSGACWGDATLAREMQVGAAGQPAGSTDIVHHKSKEVGPRRPSSQQQKPEEVGRRRPVPQQQNWKRRRKKEF